MLKKTQNILKTFKQIFAKIYNVYYYFNIIYFHLNYILHI